MIPGPDDLSPEACDALALRAQAGDREAFSELVVALYPQLTGFLAFHAPSAELADEIAQATLVMAFERIADYQPRGTCAGWLKGIARNLLRRELSRRAHQRGGVESILAVDALEAVEQEPEPTADEELLERLRACIGRLPPRARLIAQRRFAEDVPLNQLAQQFKRTRASMAKVIHLLRGQLRACVESAGGVP